MDTTKLTDRARHIVAFAEVTAKSNSQNFTTAHLLVGILKEENNIGCKVLERLGVRLERVEIQLTDTVEDVSLGEFELAVKQAARSLDHWYPGAEHLLLAICRTEGCSAARVLQAMDIDLRMIELDVLRLLGNAD
jgi:ATP-dependent Clp protease ATP-binding subunit ClpC